MARKASQQSSLWDLDGGPLLLWYEAHGRDLPWRKTRDPYRVWVSEVMLQQTQVATVLPYYDRWMARFPTLAALADSTEDDVLSLWQGLGYYRRCRLLLRGARWVLDNGVPTTAAGWTQVPGVGPYTAHAIASICFDEAVATVDGNIERVFARITGSRSEGAELKAKAWEWAAKNLYRPRPGDWNQALMELGATVCTPRRPTCDACPLIDLCVARQSWQTDSLPVKRKQDRVVQLHHIVWVPLCAGRFGVRRIPAGNWWEGMWEFPRVEVAGEEGSSHAYEALQEIVGSGWVEELGVLRHTITNHRVTLEASLVRCETPAEGLRWVDAKELEALPMPVSQRKVLRLALGLL